MAGLVGSSLGEGALASVLPMATAQPEPLCDSPFAISLFSAKEREERSPPPLMPTEWEGLSFSQYFNTSATHSIPQGEASE